MVVMVTRICRFRSCMALDFRYHDQLLFIDRPYVPEFQQPCPYTMTPPSQVYSLSAKLVATLAMQA